MPKTLVIPTVFTAVDKMSGVVERMAGSIKAFAHSNPTMKFFHSVREGADSIFEKLVNIKTALAGVALFEGGKQIYEKVKQVAELGNAAHKTGKVLGMTAETFQELQYAAKLSDIEPEAFTKGLEKLSRNIGDLKVNSGSLFTTLRAIQPTLSKVGLGSFIKDLQHVKTNEEAFNMITKAVDKMPNPFKRAQLAQAAFGKAGIDMLKLLNDGPAGVAKLREEAKKYGGVISNEAAAKSEEFLDTQSRMDFAMQGLTNTLGAALMPKLQQLAERATEWIGNNRTLINQKVSEWADKISRGLDWLVNNFDKIILGAKIFIGTLIAMKVISLATTLIMWGITAATIAYNIAMGVAGAVTGVASIAIGGSEVALAAYKITMMAATAATWLWNAALAVATSPITLIVLALAAIAAAVYLVIKYWDQWGASATAVFALINAPIAFMLSLIMSIHRNWQMISDAFTNGGIMAGIKAIGVTIFDAILQPLQQILALAGKLPGMGWAANAAAGIGKFRENIGATVESGGNAAPVPAINPQQERQNAINQTTTSNKNSNVTVDFKNLPQGAQVTQGGNGNPAVPVTSSTMTFGG